MLRFEYPSSPAASRPKTSQTSTPDSSAAEKIPINFDASWIMEGGVIATETPSSGTEVKHEACQPADVTMADASPPQVKESQDMKADALIGDMTRRVILEERMKVQKQNIMQAQAMDQMYEKARDEAAAEGAIAAPRRAPPQARLFRAATHLRRSLAGAGRRPVGAEVRRSAHRRRPPQKRASRVGSAQRAASAAI